MSEYVNKPSEAAVRQEAGERAGRAQRYAVLFPHFIKEGEERFQDVNWQEDYLRKVYKMEPVNREAAGNVNIEAVNRRKYMRDYQRKKRAMKRGEI